MAFPGLIDTFFAQFQVVFSNFFNVKTKVLDTIEYLCQPVLWYEICTNFREVREAFFTKHVLK